MAKWFLYFLIYSFLGYCLEKLFARAIRSARQVRKCFLFLPLCPVYALGMFAVLALVDPRYPFFVQAVLGGILCTAAEYMVHLFYDRVFHVQFWDYSALPFHVNGRICPRFALIWGVLSAAAVQVIHPVVASLSSAIPSALTFVLWLVFAADCVFTAAVLRQYRDTELLSFAVLLSQQ